MTEDEEAEAAMLALAGVRYCPWCGQALYENYVWPLLMDDRPKYNCPNGLCNACCFDANAEPLQCRKFEV